LGTGSILRATRSAVTFLRLRPFNAATLEGRSKERYRRAALTTVASGCARAVSLGTMLITVPLTVRYLGTERYSLWMTISSVVAMMAFADLGIGNGLLNAISETHGKDDQSAAARYVSSAFFMLGAIGALVLLLALAGYRIIPWAAIFNVKSALAIHEAGPACAVFIACFALNLPLGVVQRVQAGYQEGYKTHIWTGVGSVLGLAGVLAAIYMRAGLPWLVLGMAGGPVVASAMNGSVLFGEQRRWLRPRMGNASGIAAKRVLSTGLMFFVMQVAIVVGYQADNLVIAQVLGAEKVAQYAVPFKLFSITPMLLAMIMMPLWPAYGEAMTRGDKDWVVKTLKRSVLLGLGISLPANALLIVFGRQIVHAWVGPQIAPTLALLWGLGVWGVLAGISWPLGMFLNGISAVRFQAVCASVMAISSISLAILLTRRIGLPGAVYAMALAQAGCVLLPIALYMPRLLNRVHSAHPEKCWV
jgi:O-antigen/teichoic acid export membrane protein